MIIIDKNRELELVDFFNSLTKAEQDVATCIFTKAAGSKNVEQCDKKLIEFHKKLNDCGKLCMYDLSLCALGVAVTESSL